ncbi:MAG: M24 family metallopeptidase [Promethearchaeota archaeon]
MKYEIQKEKANQTRGILKELDIDAWLVWVRETSQMADPVLELILGGDLVWQSALIFTPDEKLAIVGNLDMDGVKSKDIYDSVIPYTKGIRDELVKHLSRLDPQKIAINYSVDDVAADGLSVGMHKLLLDNLKNTPYSNRLISAENLIRKLRGRKTPEEVSRIRKAIEITEHIFGQAEKFVKVEMSEPEIYDLFHRSMNDFGVSSAWDEDHNPAVDAGPYKQFGHSGPIEQSTTKDGHLLHFDFGVKYNDYCSDIQRMFFFGKKSEVPADVQDAFETVRDGIQAAARFIKPGAVGYEVDAIARDFVKAAGYEEYDHALGHQIGRLAHDGGTLLGPKWERYGESPMGVVEVGNVFTLEFYVTTQRYGQVSLEEDILITKQGCEFLSKPQLNLICIE